uniref:Uncharacterized protein n=1 Tax=Amphora coffeiformis TaxID=265554 RepID=A0A7S3L017_9STRA
MSSPPRYLQYRATLAHTVPTESPRSDMKDADPIISPAVVNDNNKNNNNNPSSRFQTYRHTLKQGVVALTGGGNNNHTLPNNNDSDTNTTPTQDEDEDLLLQSSSSSPEAAAATNPSSGTNMEQDNMETAPQYPTTTTIDTDGKKNPLNGSMQRYLASQAKHVSDDDDEDDDGANGGVVQMELTVRPSRCRSPSPRFQRYRESLKEPGLRSDDESSVSSFSSSRTDEELERSATELQKNPLLGSMGNKEERAESTDEEGKDETEPPPSANPSSRLEKYRNALKQHVVPDDSAGPPTDPTSDAPSSSSGSGSPDRYQKYRSLLANNVTDPTGKPRPWVQDSRALSGGLGTVSAALDDHNNNNESSSSSMDGSKDDGSILSTPSRSVDGSSNRYSKYRSLLAGKVTTNLSANESSMDEESNVGSIFFRTPSSSVCESPERYKKYRSLLADKIVVNTPEEMVVNTQTLNNPRDAVTDKLLEMAASSDNSVNTSDSSNVAPFLDGQQGSLTNTAPSLLADTAIGPKAPPLPDGPGRAATETSSTQPRYLAYRSALASGTGLTKDLPPEPDRSSNPSDSSSSSGSLSQPGKGDREVSSSPAEQHDNEDDSIHMGSEKNDESSAVDDKENDESLVIGEGVGLQVDGTNDERRKGATKESSARLGPYLEKAEAEKTPIRAHEADMHTSWSDFDPADMPDTASRVSTASRRGQKKDIVAAQQRVINQALASAGLVSKTEKQEVLRHDIQAERLRMHEKNVKEIQEDEKAENEKDIETGNVSDEKAKGMHSDEKAELQAGIETGEVSETCSMQPLERKTWQKLFLAFTTIGGILMIVFAFITGLR